MTTRENIAQAMVRAEFEPMLSILSAPVADNTFDIMWDRDAAGCRTRALVQLDAALSALLTDPGHDVTAAIIAPGEDRTPAIHTFHAIVLAIKDGK